MRARMLWASLTITAVIVSGGAVPASAAPVDRAADLQQQILERVRAAAAPAAAPDIRPENAPPSEVTVNPGEGAVLDAAGTGVRAQFSGHDVGESVFVHAAPLGDAAAVSAASETGGVVAGAPVEIRAHTDDGDDVTQFPASYTLERDASGIEVAKNVVPGVRLNLDVDAAALQRAGVDRLRRRGQPHGHLALERRFDTVRLRRRRPGDRDHVNDSGAERVGRRAGGTGPGANRRTLPGHHIEERARTARGERRQAGLCQAVVVPRAPLRAVGHGLPRSGCVAGLRLRV